MKPNTLKISVQFTVAGIEEPKTCNTISAVPSTIITIIAVHPATAEPSSIVLTYPRPSGSDTMGFLLLLSS
jgi:hypothetical protein